MKPKTKVYIWFILCITILLAMIIHNSVFGLALQIIPENDLENKSLEICSEIYGSSTTNQTLNCINFFLGLAANTSSSTTIIQQDLSSIDKDYIERRIAERLVESSFLNIAEITNLVDEGIARYDNKKTEEFDSVETQAQRDHEFRMKELELGKEEEIVVEAIYTEVELKNKIADALQKQQPQQETPAPKQEKDYMTLFFLAVAVIVVGYLIYKKYMMGNSYQLHNPPLPQPKKKPDDEVSFQTW
jgi:molecular chaperone DnaK (HSP70)